MVPDRNKPLWQLTVAEFLALLEEQPKPEPIKEEFPAEKYVYGISGIAKLFGCSNTTANKIKQSGEIDAAIRQIGRKIVVDVEIALKLKRTKK